MTDFLFSKNHQESPIAGWGTAYRVSIAFVKKPCTERALQHFAIAISGILQPAPTLILLRIVKGIFK